jgi:poly(A) polymerase
MLQTVAQDWWMEPLQTVPQGLGVEPWNLKEALERRLSRPEDGNIRVKDVIACLLDAGVAIYAVGGAPRDWLAGVRCDDVDLALDHDLAAAHRILRAGFPGFDPPTPSVRGFGLMRWGDPRVEQVDVNILRSWRAAVGQAEFISCPFEVCKDLVEDAQTRDFSINALYYDFREQRIVDPLGVGRDDIDERRLRFVGHPETLRSNSLTTIRIFTFLWRGYTATPEVLAHLEERADREIQRMAERAPMHILRRFITRQTVNRGLDPDALLRLASPYIRDHKTWRIIESLFQDAKAAG